MFRLLHGGMEFKVGPLSLETGLIGTGSPVAEFGDTAEMITPGMIGFYMPRSFLRRMEENGVDGLQMVVGC